MVLEGAFIEQILADDGLSSLIDEMIYGAFKGKFNASWTDF